MSHHRIFFTIGSFVVSLCFAIHNAALAIEPCSYQQAWIQNGWLDQRDGAKSLVIDSCDNVYVVGSTGNVYGTPEVGPQGSLLTKYNTSGNLLWLEMVTEESGLDHIKEIAIDTSDNVFMVGDNYHNAAGTDACLIKFDSSGNKLWDRHLSSPDNEFNRDIAIDTQGNAYVVGSTTGILVDGAEGSGYDGFLAKYLSNGDLAWIKQFPNSISNGVRTVTVDDSNNICIAGYVTSQFEPFLAKLNSEGEFIWYNNPNYSSLSDLNTEIYDSASDSQGNLYCCGYTNGVHDNAYGFQAMDAVLAKHDSNGNLLWKRTLQTDALDLLGSISLDDEGNIFVSGITRGDLGGENAGDYDAFWAKYDSSGNLLWLEQFGTPFYDGATTIDTDSLGHVYLSGSTLWDVGDYYLAESDMFLIRYDPVPEPTVLSLLVFGGLATLMLVKIRKD